MFHTIRGYAVPHGSASPRRLVHGLRAAGLGVLLAGALATGAAPAGAAPDDTAHSAASFVDSVGVVTHFRYADTTYGQVDALLGKVKALGVHHIRDGLTPNPTPELLAAFHKLPDYGIRLNLVVGSAGVSDGVLPDPAALLGVAHDSGLRPIVETIETANEWDSKGGPQWLPDLQNYQCALFDAVHQNAEWADVPVIGPSVARRFRVPLLTGMADCQDYVNAHNYANGAPPEDALDLLDQARANAPGKPIIVTETGYHTALNRTQNQRPVTEDVKAQYLLRTLLENYAAGVTRTYVYQLADERVDPTLTEQEAYFGLIRPDLSETPAYQALQSLTSLLADQGTGAALTAPNAVTVTPSAQAQGTAGEVHHLLLTKADGTEYVVLWQRAALPDPAAASTTVRIDLAKPAAAFVVDGRGVTAQPQGNSVTVTGLDRVKVVQIGGSKPTFAPSTPPTAQPTVPATSGGSGHGVLLGVGALLLLLAAGGGATVAVLSHRAKSASDAEPAPQPLGSQPPGTGPTA
ncbi:MAG: hypothetical protein IPH03_14880 [Tetrasphaera sp.]|nr:hypothetical protein [Tetrasphaera sp.]